MKTQQQTTKVLVTDAQPAGTARLARALGFWSGPELVERVQEIENAGGVKPAEAGRQTGGARYGDDRDATTGMMEVDQSARTRAATEAWFVKRGGR